VRKILVFVVICLIFILYAQDTRILYAQQSAMNDDSQSFVSSTSPQKRTQGVIGEVDYVEFKSKGKSKIVVEDRNGDPVEVSLKNLKDGATVLVTYRKEKDKEGKEENVLISLSVIKNAPQKKGSRGKR